MTKKLVAYIKKPTDKIEIISAIKYFKIEEILFYTDFNEIRISNYELNCWISDFGIKGKVELINLKKETSKDFFNRIINQSNIKYVAIPIGINSIFYKLVPKLRKQGVKIIHLSDGTQDAFPLLNANIALRAKNLKGLIKALITYPFYLRAKADYCFFQLYPLKSCYSKQSLPVIERPKLKLYNHPYIDPTIDQLIVSGWGETIESLKKIIDLKKDFIASSKGLEVIINDDKYVTDINITAEDLIDLLPLKKIVSSGSTAALYAKLQKPDIDVCVKLNGALNSFYGFTFEKEYKKIANKIGIEIHDR